MKKKGLKDRTINELRAQAKKKGIRLLRSMKKQDILKALEKSEKPRKAARGKAASTMKPGTGVRTRRPATAKKAAVKAGRTGKAQTATPKTSRRKTSSTVKPAAGVRTQRAATAKKTAVKAARTGKAQAATPKTSRRRTSAGALKTAAVMKETLNTAPQPVRGKQVPKRLPVKTADREASNPPLPEEYGENDFFLIAVDPDVVYASWEIRPEDLPGRRALTMRLFDVTGSGPSGRAQRFFDITLAKRVGSGFFEIKMSGRDVIAEIGHRRGDGFQSVLRSNMVSFPVPMHYHETGAQEPPEPGTPVGY